MQDEKDLEELIGLARRELYSAVIADTLDALGWREQALSAAIRPLDDALVLCGWARVGLFLPIYEEDRHAYDEEIRLIDSLRPDEVPVLCCHGSLRLSVWGELMSTRATYLKAAGLLTDGCVRDVRAIREMRFPVFAAGVNPTDTKCRGRLTVSDVQGRIGGVAVAPGDLVFGDADGVVVVPRAGARDVVAKALEKVRTEDTVRDALRRGETLGDVFRRHGVL